MTATRRTLNLLFLLCTLITCSGFGWGLGTSDPCEESRKLIETLPSVTDPSKRDKLENSIITTCATGAPGLFIKALQAERNGKPDEAASLYRSVIAAGPEIADAYGNLGLLLHAKGHDGEAAAALTRGLLHRPDPRYHRALAEIMNAARLPDLALLHYGETLKAFPSEAALHKGRADAYLQLGQYDNAEKEFLYLRKQKPVASGYAPELAGVYRKAGRLDQAISELRPYLLTHANDQNAHRLLAEVLMETGQREAARKEFLSAGVDVTINPEDFAKKGDEFMQTREYGQAIGAYQTALKGRPDLHDVRHRLGKAQMAAGRDDDAMATFNDLIASGYKNGEIYYETGLLHERGGQYDDAIAAYRLSVVQDPATTGARRRLAEIYTWHGNYLEAAEQYNELLRLRGDTTLFHLGLGKVYEKLKDRSRAIREFETVVRLDPNHLEGHRELARLLMLANQIAAAESHYKEVIRLHIDDEVARNALITLYVKNKRYDDLTIFVKEWLDKAPDDPQRLYRLGIVYEFKKDYDQAITEYKKAIEQQPGNARMLLALGRTYMKSGRISESRELLERARAADPRLTEPQLLLSSISGGQASGKMGSRKTKKPPPRRKAVLKKAARRK